MKTNQQNAFTNPWGKDANGKEVYSSGNDPSREGTRCVYGYYILKVN